MGGENSIFNLGSVDAQVIGKRIKVFFRDLKDGQQITTWKIGVCSAFDDKAMILEGEKGIITNNIINFEVLGEDKFGMNRRYENGNR
ncbi:MAG: hypothetical protein V1663_01025 [archaeon]